MGVRQANYFAASYAFPRQAPSYIHGSAAPAYRNEPLAQPERTRISTIPGSGKDAALSSTLISVAKAVAIIFVALALLGIIRVTLNSATVTSAIEARELSSQIETLRSESSTLEVTQTALTQPEHIKDQAKALGLVEPSSVTYLTFGEDGAISSQTVSMDQGDGDDLPEDLDNME